MSQYLLSFAKEHLTGKSDAYLALLWCMYKANNAKGRYSEHIKSYLGAAPDRLLTIDYQRLASRFKAVLDARPELESIAPMGLSALSSLQVKNFRGFGELGQDDKGTLIRFTKIKNIFYAPNGGGKSSLCEALEYGTTGHIKEADRRKTKIRQYIARGAGKTSLILKGTDKKTVTRSLTWSSCFIDRNRLQEFSLLGSKDTGSAESDVIATLFGLEELQEVISRFVKPESFSLKSSLRPDNTDAIAVVDSDKLQLIQQRRSGALKVSALNKQVCETLGLEESQQYAVRARFKRLEALAELKMRRAEQLKLARSPCLFPVRHFFRSSRIAERLLQRKAKIESAFLQNASALNYRAVFEAIQAIEHQGAGDACPACSTPLQSVAENPFEKARRELQSLSALDQLQSAEKRNQDLIVKLAMGISKRFSGVGLNAQQGIACPLPLSDLESAVINFQSKVDRLEAALVVIQAFEKLLIQNQPELEAYAADCQSKHTEVAQANETVNRLDEQVKDLKESEEVLRRLFNEKKGAWHACAQANSKIADLIRRRAELIEHGSSSVLFNSFVQELQTEYGNLYEDLISYKLSLERARISGIESKAADYYKTINNHDDEHERIDSISFDKTSDSYRIKIANADGTSLDAFSTLSEGHLRALGLSLLLAMAEKNKFPLIVFDDVVNAIDSDHRSNIIDLFFSDPYLRRTQMVVTTHDRLFWERYCIIAERHTQSDQHSSYVLNYTNKGIISVDHAGGFQEKVYRALAVYDVRQALIYCRIWFESMVLEYCLANGLSVTARFEKSQLKKNMYLQISLEKTFSLVEPEIAYDLTHFSLIKNDLVNWGGQNQEHHAFDEGSLNFVHSKTSKEVVKIYDAIRLLECQLFPKTKKISGQHLLDTLNQRIAAGTRKIEKLGGAPAEVRAQHAGLLSELQKRAAEVTEELAFIEVCLAAIEPRLEPAEHEPEQGESTAPE